MFDCCTHLNLTQFKHRVGVLLLTIPFRYLLVQKFVKLRHQNSTYFLVEALYHLQIMHFFVQAVNFTFVVVNFFLLHYLKLLVSIFVLLLQTSRFLQNEVTQDKKTIFLVDRFSFKNFCYFCQSLLYFFHLALDQIYPNRQARIILHLLLKLNCCYLCLIF